MLAREDRTLFAVLLTASALLASVYLLFTLPQKRSYDYVPHMNYLQLIEQTGKIPGTRTCWQCYHPPAYYLTAFAVTKIFGADNPASRGRLLQLVSLLMFIAFQAAGLSITLSSFASRRWKLLASILFAFWPAGLIHSVRVSNDMLVCMLQGLSLLFLISWRDSHSRTALAISVITAVLAVWTKFNGLLSLVLVAATCLIDAYVRSRSIKQTLKDAWPPVAASIAGFCALIAYQFARGGGFSNTDRLVQGVRVENSAQHLMWLDWSSFLGRAFIDPWRDETGRQFFWNYWLKTSIFGEFSFSRGAGSAFLSRIAAISLLLIIIPLCLGFYRAIRDRRMYIFAMNLLLLTAAAWAFRLTNPFACTADFRYSYPAVIPIAVLTANGCEHIRTGGGKLASFLESFFCAAAVGFAAAGTFVIFSALVTF